MTQNKTTTSGGNSRRSTTKEGRVRNSAISDDLRGRIRGPRPHQVVLDEAPTAEHIRLIYRDVVQNGPGLQEGCMYCGTKRPNLWRFVRDEPRAGVATRGYCNIQCFALHHDVDLSQFTVVEN